MRCSRIFLPIYLLHKHGKRPCIYFIIPVKSLVNHQLLSCLTVNGKCYDLIQVSLKMSVDLLWSGILSHKNLHSANALGLGLQAPCGQNCFVASAAQTAYYHASTSFIISLVRFLVIPLFQMDAA